MNLVKITSSILLFIFTCTTLKAQFNFDTYALEHVNIIDVNTKTVLNDYTIVISKDKILTILPSKDYFANDSVQSIVLKNNGIKRRFYALTKEGKSTHTNAQMTALAVKSLFKNH